MSAYGAYFIEIMFLVKCVVLLADMGYGRLQKEKTGPCFGPTALSLWTGYSDFQGYSRAKKHKTYICKPDSGCQGRGIYLTKSNKDIRPGEHMICQVYIAKPFVLDGFKFDLRIYVLVTSCEPFRVFMYNEGLVRFCTSQYTEPTVSNLGDVCMHLTNYAINKHSENFVRDEDTGSKRKLSSFKNQMEDLSYDTEKLWTDIEDVIIKTLISAHPILKHNYQTCFPNHACGSACFEILGFDVLLDRRLKPWLLEVNHSPSFTTDSQLDREVKDRLLYDTLVLINLGACDRRKIIEEEKRRVKERLQENRPREARNEELRQSQAASVEQMQKYEAKHMGGFRRIFPREGGEKYEKYFQHSSSLFQETAASKAREECARQQLQELRLKQEQKERYRKGSHKLDLQGESAGERGKPRKKMPLHLNPTSLPSMPESSPLVSPEQTEEEETERLSELQQREALLVNMGVVQQVRQLLHGANNPNECSNSSSLPPYCRHDHKYSLAEVSWRQKNLSSLTYQQDPPKARLCPHRKLWPSLDPALLQPIQGDTVALKHYEGDETSGAHSEHRASAGLMRAQGIPQTINSFLACHPTSECRSKASVFPMPPLVAGRPHHGTMFQDPNTLYVISTAAHLIPRPHLSHVLRKAHHCSIANEH
ncbi:hypothetical protein DNTS_032648 [Danionella cerebrum]|uniref:Uncharacterized protein n=1 Tax=Danionella cerebrum TaxID=2873325 RepID=A0A553MPQ0_9TELE|nr:hypothetical protein DNTS_032648 [Danionella translucida]